MSGEKEMSWMAGQKRHDETIAGTSTRRACHVAMDQDGMG
jgi:hypothetical protein